MEVAVLDFARLHEFLSRCLLVPFAAQVGGPVSVKRCAVAFDSQRPDSTTVALSTIRTYCLWDRPKPHPLPAETIFATVFLISRKVPAMFADSANAKVTRTW